MAVLRETASAGAVKDLLASARRVGKPFTAHVVDDVSGALACAAATAGFAVERVAGGISGSGAAWTPSNQQLLGTVPYGTNLTRGEARADVVLLDLVSHGEGPDVFEKPVRQALGLRSRQRPAALVVAVAPMRVDIAAERLQQQAELIAALTSFTYMVTCVTFEDAALGGALARSGRFLVFSRVPLGVSLPTLPWVPTLRDAIGDLENQPEDWQRQPYREAPTWWSNELRCEDGPDGHMPLVQVAIGHEHRSRAQHSKPPPSMIVPWGSFGFDVTRLAGLHHPNGNRLLTHREIARLHGFPDAWSVAYVKGSYLMPISQICVQPARWLMTWVLASLDGRPGPTRGAEASRLVRVLDLVQNGAPSDEV